MPRFRTKSGRWSHPLGQVFDAEDVQSGDAVVLTLLHPTARLSDHHVEGVRSTAWVLRGLDHPGIHGIRDAQRFPDGRLAVVNEAIDAGVLATHLGRALPASRAVAILRQACRVLRAAHQVGILHGALSVGSILLGTRGGRPDHVTITDFGLHGAVEAGLRVPEGDAALVPVSPERALGMRRTAAEDIYLLGCLGYVMLTGGPPFRTGNLETIERRHAIEDPMPIERRLRSSEAPGPLVDVIHRCLAKDPEDRFADLADLEAELCLAQIEAGIRTAWDHLPLPPVEAGRRLRIGQAFEASIEEGPPKLPNVQEMQEDNEPSMPIDLDALPTTIRHRGPGSPPLRPLPEAFPVHAVPYDDSDSIPLDILPRPTAPPPPRAGLPPRATPPAPPRNGLPPRATPELRPASPPPTFAPPPPPPAGPAVTRPASTVPRPISPGPADPGRPGLAPRPPATGLPAERASRLAPALGRGLGTPTPPSEARLRGRPSALSRLREAPRPPIPAPIRPHDDDSQERALAPTELGGGPPPVRGEIPPQPDFRPDPAADDQILRATVPARPSQPAFTGPPLPEILPAPPAPEPSAEPSAGTIDVFDPPRAERSPRARRPVLRYAAVSMLGIAAAFAFALLTRPEPAPATTAWHRAPRAPDARLAAALSPLRPTEPLEPLETPSPDTAASVTTRTTARRASGAAAPKPSPRAAEDEATAPPRPPRSARPAPPPEPDVADEDAPPPSPAPRDADGLASEGNAAFNRGDFAEASRLLERAVKQDPSNAKYRILLGDAYFKQGRWDAASRHYERARALGHASAGRRLEKVAEKMAE